jgi:glycosyltransferase involved in cell wall biosynthesis
VRPRIGVTGTLLAVPEASVTGRVLWVTEEPPDRALGGGSIRQAHLFRAVAAAFPTDLLLAGRLADPEVRAAAAHVFELPPRPALWSEQPLVRRGLELAITLASPHPSACYPGARNRRALARALASRTGAYAVACVEHAALAPLARALGATRSIITFHHLISAMVAQSLTHTAGARQQWFRRRDLTKAQTLERRALRDYERVLTCSAEDAGALAALGASSGRCARIEVVPNGVDLAAFRATPLPSAPRVLFPGSLAYAPNVDGAVWFCREVWPAVRAGHPGAELVLAGREPVAEVRELARLPGVSVHADVPSMVDYFEAARVVVVPLRVGTGTRLKALEAMAAARAVVGTSVGLEGIGVSDGVQALVREDPESMAQAVLDALSDDVLARRLAGAAREHVAAHYGWERIGARLVELVGELLADPGGGETVEPVAAAER